MRRGDRCRAAILTIAPRWDCRPRRRRPHGRAPFLCLIERGIGALEQLIDAFARSRFGNAEAARHRPLAAIGIERQFSQADAQAFGECPRSLKIGALEQNGKFFTTESADNALLVRGFAADAAKHLVANVMPAAVVDVLEMVDVEHDGRKRHLAHALGALEEGATVEDAGQWIDAGQADQLALQAKHPLR